MTLRLPETTWLDRFTDAGRLVASFYRIGAGWWEFAMPGRVAAGFVAEVPPVPGTTLRVR